MFNYIGFNLQVGNSILSDQEPCSGDPSLSRGLAMRKAISHAFNKQEINTIIHGGKYLVNDYPLHPYAGEWINPQLTTYEYDLELARDYVEKIGYNPYPPSTTTNVGLDMFLSSILGCSILLATLIVRRYRKQKG
jgi:ABC-type transport system substrate-binding protein